jgi:hypothetical protein
MKEMNKLGLDGKGYEVKLEDEARDFYRGEKKGS